MTMIIFSNYLKVGVEVIKEKYEFHTNYITSRKATPASTYLKNYFGSNSNQKHGSPTSNSDFKTLT